jgi:hypothetical protein
MVLICFISLMGLLSCGLEAFYYIDNIPLSVYEDTSSTVNLPSSSYEGYSTYFKNFIIFYRIYSSANFVQTGMILTGSGTNNDRITINSALNSDYNSLWSLTDITSTSFNPSTSLENTFDNRNYFKLALEGADVDSVLGSRALGGTLLIRFDPRNTIQPTLNLSGTSYVLQRATDLSAPEPDRRFLNAPELYDRDNANVDINADVAAGTGEIRYTYVSMYIAAKGTSLEMPPQNIYSQPTFLGIFRLSEWSN